ncbi:unnamed protein product [Clonostachys byssicola]|uniref:Uncharacterized protein n=1 Tax=Clonostachys byssicola TaxID=160290 RepID=A0A9N9UYP0_9HYPO|nr:unnamed protein product [Clonostachys byssicola]
MPHLLKIPLELRQEIFHWVICSLVEPPESPVVEQEHRQPLPYGEYLRQGIWNEGDFLSRAIWHRAPTNPALSLLQVNKQIHDEVSRFLRHVPTDCDVDIMYVKESGLWPTWSVPKLPETQYIDSVRATFRIFNHPEDLGEAFWYKGMWTRMMYHSPTFHRVFYGLLTSFLKRGPGLLDRTHPEDDESISPRYIVRKIFIDIVAPTDGTQHSSILMDESRYPKGRSATHLRYTYGDHDDVDTPPEERLASHLSKQLENLLFVQFWCYEFIHLMIIYEQVAEEFIFTVNGEEFKRVSMEDGFQKLKQRFFPPGSEDLEANERPGGYRVWGNWVEERRLRMKEGLELDNRRPAGVESFYQQ